MLADKNVREKDFDVDGFLNVLEPYYKNGEYGYLLNSDKELDLLNKRFIAVSYTHLSFVKRKDTFRAWNRWN